MTFVPKNYEIEPSHRMRSVYHLEKLDSVVYFLDKGDSGADYSIKFYFGRLF